MTTPIEVKDAHESDKRIPRDLIITYQGKPYITRAGLAWKMNYLFGGGNWGINNEIVEKTADGVIVRSSLKLTTGVEFTNYGEANKQNVSNPAMLKHLLHLAVTRAENRVMRTATACGYTSIEEMDMEGERTKQVAALPDGDKPATAEQLKVLEGMGKEVKENMTQQEAVEVMYAK